MRSKLLPQHTYFPSCGPRRKYLRSPFTSLSGVSSPYQEPKVEYTYNSSS